MEGSAGGALLDLLLQFYALNSIAETNQDGGDALGQVGDVDHLFLYESVGQQYFVLYSIL